MQLVEAVQIELAADFQFRGDSLLFAPLHDLLRQIFLEDLIPFSQNLGPLQGVVQLANIARPGVVAEQFDHRLGDFPLVAEEVFNQQANVTVPLTQRGKMDFEDIDSIDVDDDGSIVGLF